MNAPVEPAGTRSDRGLRAAVVLGAAVIVLAALYFTGTIFAPLAFAMLIIAVMWPLQERLQARLPKLVALFITMLATVVILAAFVSLIAWGFGRVGRFVIADAPRFQFLYAQVAAWIEGHGIVLAGFWAEHFNVGRLIGLFQQVTVRLNGMLSFSLVTLIYVMLGLLEVDDMAARLRAPSAGEFGRIALAGGAETAAKLRRYMWVRTLMSVLTGALVSLFALAVGLPLAAEWGVIAFALNYIPFIGPFIATLFPTLFAIAQFPSWQMAAVVFACLNLIQFLVGSYLEPRIAGNALSISPFLVLFAVFFWAFMWGIAGAFIGVPIVIAALTLCAQHPSTQWIAELLGGPGRERKPTK
jgi:AI-2 transport protein TqsA